MSTADAQGALWGAAARDWAELAEPHQIPFYEAALDGLACAGGMRLLDAGCGAGLALSLAAARGAAVSGLDASRGLLGDRPRAPAGRRPARGRPRRAALRGRQLRCRDRLQLGAVRGRSDGRAARDSAASRVPAPASRSRPGDRRSSARCERCWARSGSLLPPPPPGAVGPFALAAPGALETLVEGAGLTPSG